MWVIFTTSNVVSILTHWIIFLKVVLLESQRKVKRFFLIFKAIVYIYLTLIKI